MRHRSRSIVGVSAKLHVSAIVLACAILLALCEPLEAQDYATASQMLESDTGLSRLSTDHNEQRVLAIISVQSLPRLQELLEHCSATTDLPGLRVLENGIRSSGYQGSVGLEVEEGASDAFCQARRISDGQLVDGEEGIVASPNLYGQGCVRWKVSIARFLAVLRAPSDHNPCNASTPVQYALTDLFGWHSSTSGISVNVPFVSWSAQLSYSQGTQVREVSLYANARNELVARVSAKEGDSLSELSQAMTGHGTFWEARRGDILDFNIIYPGQSLEFLGHHMKREVWQNADHVSQSSRILSGAYPVHHELRWNEISRELWGSHYALGSPWLWTLNPGDISELAPPGEVKVPLEIASWIVVDNETIGEWEGVDESTSGRGIILTQNQKADLKNVFCPRATGACSLPILRVITFD